MTPRGTDTVRPRWWGVSRRRNDRWTRRDYRRRTIWAGRTPPASPPRAPPQGRRRPPFLNCDIRRRSRRRRIRQRLPGRPDRQSRAGCCHRRGGVVRRGRYEEAMGALMGVGGGRSNLLHYLFLLLLTLSLVALSRQS